VQLLLRAASSERDAKLAKAIAERSGGGVAFDATSITFGRSGATW
jgi:hypothetical protein